jgi:Na+/H+ antiporter NhaD/arsenite permease-like protein
MSVSSKIGSDVLAAAVVLVCGTGSANAVALGELVPSWPWALPFLGLLLSIALGPLLIPSVWHAHYGKIAFIWSTLTLAPLAALHGIPAAWAALVHAIVGEYLRFITMLASLYVVAGGILVTGSVRATPLVNAATLAFGTVIASIVGTTGATMILIRPLLRVNSARLNNVHVVIFFIFLAANVGGALSPLGDPPLFLGFLHGIDFFWPAMHLWRQTALTVALVLFVFLVVDLWYYRQDRRVTVVGETARDDPLRIHGLVNLLLIVLIVGVILLSAVWKGGIVLDIGGTTLPLGDLVRDIALGAIAVASLVFTPEEHRERNGFTWEPIREVAKLFAGIFVCVAPVSAMLHAGHQGPFSWVLALMTDAAGEPRNIAYFWITGTLSAVLDNAPTYLVFFELLGGDAARLMNEYATTLTAISMGAVYMGAMTYVGNAPNLMIYAIATERGVKMPSFFGYMIWSCAVLLPVFAIVTSVFLAAPR